MASLSIEVGAAADRNDRGPIGLIAELERLDGPRERHQPRKVAVSSRQAKVVDGLAEGLWQVRLVMPGGREQLREVEVGGSRIAAVSFMLGSTRSRPTPPPPAPPVRRRRGLPRLGDLLSFRYATAAKSHPAALDAQTPVVEFATVESVSGEPVQLWADLARAATEGTLLDAVGSGAGAVAVPEAPRADDELRWRFAGDQARRTYASAGTRFHCVPVPWRTHELDNPVALLLDCARAESRTRIVVEDDGFAGLLAYLSSGSVMSAVDLLDADAALGDSVGRRAQDVLHGKRASPLGACAAGYALLGSAVPGTTESWHPWIANLAQWFEWIPDGAILLARLQLMQASDDQDAEIALATLVDALGRGIPYYRRGFDWLLQAMLRFPDEPVVAGVRPALSNMAARLDMREVFTTLATGGAAP